MSSRVESIHQLACLFHPRSSGEPANLERVSDESVLVPVSLSSKIRVLVGSDDTRANENPSRLISIQLEQPTKLSGHAPPRKGSQVSDPELT